MTQGDDMDFELLLAKRMVQNSFFGDYRGENIEWPDVFDVPDYSLLVANELVPNIGMQVANELVPNIGMQPPDGKCLCFNLLGIDEIFDERLKIHEDESD